MINDIRKNFKLHKIRGVDLDTCTAEQVIAYNYAHSCYHDYIDAYRHAEHEYDKIAVCNQCIRACIDMIMVKRISDIADNGKHNGYDVDAIYYALHAGMRRYFENGYSILASYDTVGDIFNLACFGT